MAKRLQTLGVVLALFGLGFFVASGYTYLQTKAGSDSLQAFSAAQNVTLSYNEDGLLTDRGTTEGADAIMDLLENTWGYPVKASELDPADPLVNTGTEYMYQMATIGYHVLHGTQTIVLDEAVDFDGQTFEAGSYEVVVNEVGDADRVAAGLGGYWTDFDRTHPLEGPARAQAWSGTAHGLFGELGVGAVTANTLTIGYGLAGVLAGLGLFMAVAGFGLVWVAKGKEETGVTPIVREPVSV
jgi:hypothetical protein